SLFFFCLPFFTGMDEGQQFGLFMVSFSMTLLYFILILIKGKKTEAENKIHYTFLFLILFLVSAYSLNRELPVFEDSAAWFAALLVTSCVNYAAFAYADAFPKWMIHVMSFISGISWVSFAYLSAYLLPYYALGLVGFFLLGASLHTFVPILFLIYSLKLAGKAGETDKKYWWSFLAGLTTALAIIIGYTIMWSKTKGDINQAWNDGFNKEKDLPAWINVAKEVPDNFFARKLLRTGLVYSVPGSGMNNLFWDIPGNELGETKRHDPLVMTAEFLSGKFGLDNDEKIRILQSMHPLKHDQQDRLWNGDHLTTENINTEVRFWPDCNMTYTEKTITVSNNNREKWRAQEEAIYTFYMPEGAVVTSLSLWV